MNQNELFDKAKELLAKGDISAAKDFVLENKDALGDKAKELLEGFDLNQGLDGVLDKAKDLGLDLEKAAPAGLLDKVKGFFGK